MLRARKMPSAIASSGPVNRRGSSSRGTRSRTIVLVSVS